MPRYYFHVFVPGLGRNLDPEGQDFANLAVAHDAAIVSIRKLLAELLLLGKPDRALRFEIADENDKVLLVVPFATALIA